MLSTALLLVVTAAAPTDTWVVLTPTEQATDALRDAIYERVRARSQTPKDVTELYEAMHDILGMARAVPPASVDADLRTGATACEARAAASGKSSERIFCLAQVREVAWMRHVDRERPGLVLRVTASLDPKQKGRAFVVGEAWGATDGARRGLDRNVEESGLRAATIAVVDELLSGGGRKTEKPIVLDLPAAPSATGPLFAPVSGPLVGAAVELPPGCAADRLPASITVTPAGTLLAEEVAGVLRATIGTSGKGAPLLCEVSLDSDDAASVAPGVHSTAIRLRCGDKGAQARKPGFAPPLERDALDLAKRGSGALLEKLCR